VHDPYDEVALRAVMRAHVRSGRPASALAAYVRVRERIAEDLGVDPTPETERLHDEIVLGADEVGSSQDAEPDDGAAAAEDLVGRVEELRRLDRALADVQSQGRPAVVLVHGEPGIGKTALVAEWARRNEHGAVILRGRCDELGRDLPLQPVADALSQHLRAVGPDAAATALGADAATLADILGLSVDEPMATTVTDTAVGQARLFAALLDSVERAGRDTVVVLTVDDLHLAGSSTLRWLAFARRRGRRLLVVATTRHSHPDLPGAEVLEVGPLGRADADALLWNEDEQRRAEIFTRSGGNPLFLRALARAEDGDALPTSVRDAVIRQANSLGDAAAAVEAAAVLGAEVDLDLLADVLHRPAAEVLADLEVAVESGLLDEHGDGLRFRHEIAREALDHAAGGARRALMHRDAARALAGRPEEDALAVAVHARLGGDKALAIEAYTRAAQRAYARFDTDEALVHLDSAIELGGSVDAYILRARVRMATTAFDAAALDAAEALARDGGAAALEVAGWVAYYRRRYDEARAYADAGVLRAGDDVALRASCLAVAGRVRHGSGDLAGAVEQLTATVDAPLAVQGVADVWLGQLHVHRGEPLLALQTIERALVDPDHLAHPWAPMHGRFTRVMALGQLGRIDDALTVCDDLDAAVRRSGAIGARFQGPAGNARGWVLRYAGATGAADEVNTAVCELTQGPQGGPASDSVAEYYYVSLLDLADGRLLADDLDGAARLVDELEPVDRWAGTMAWHQRHRLFLARARLALARDEHERAAELADAVAHDAEARGTRRYEVLARAWRALAVTEPDVAAVAATVDELPRLAALESWRLTAALAARYGVDAWRRDAERQVAALVATAGPHADALRRAAARVLG
jgi:tetratricopeptide (TPR) repeat protein